MKPLPLFRFLLPCCAALLTGGCASVQVAVPKPVVIDVNMKVDVTSRTADAAVKPGAPGAPATPANPSATADGAAEQQGAGGQELQEAAGVDRVHGFLSICTETLGGVWLGRTTPAPFSWVQLRRKLRFPWFPSRLSCAVLVGTP